MKKLLKILKGIALGLLFLFFILLITLYVRHGGGEAYPDLTAAPILSEHQLEPFFQYPEPLGNLAASRDTSYSTRTFFTVHPESRPSGHKVLEIIDGKAIPYPNASLQQTYFQTVLGLFIDWHHRLWTIDHGNHAFGTVRLTAFDLRTNQKVHEFQFPPEVAEKGSFFNDLTVSPDGRYVFIADVSFFRKAPSLIVYDIEQQRSRSLLDGHPSVTAQNFIPHPPSKKMSFFGGLVNLKPGIDGIDIDWQGQYVYYAAMAHDGLYRIPVSALTDFSKSPEAIAQTVEKVSEKPLSDGIRLDQYGNVYITDVEHQGFSVVNTKGKLKTLLKDQRIRWADGAAFGSDGYLYFTDSAIPDQMLMSKKHMEANKPYDIFRFKPPYQQIME